MRRMIMLLPLGFCLLLSSGCAICCAPHDCDYPYVGGRWVRNNPSSGRVGSRFDEAGAAVEPTSFAAPTDPNAIQSAPPQVPPGTRSVIPRNLGERYLPTGP